MFYVTTRFVFVSSFLTGCFLSYLVLQLRQKDVQISSRTAYEEWFKSKQLVRKALPFEILRYSGRTFKLEAEILFENITILCLILVKKSENLKAIKDTWGRNCNKLDSFNLYEDIKIVSLKKRKKDSWKTLCEFLKKVQSKMFNYTLIIEDDSFVLMENLRRFLAAKNSMVNLYLGFPVKFWNTVYNSGKAGIVLSTSVIRRMKSTSCDVKLTYRNQEDFMLGNHLAQLNISVIDSRDEYNFTLFNPYNLNKLLFNETNRSKYNSVHELKCCSSTLISFNAREADKMYTYYYLLYTLQLFYYGKLGNRFNKNSRKNDEKVWRNFLLEQNLPLNIDSEGYYKAWENLIDDPNSFGKNMKREEYPDDEG